MRDGPLDNEHPPERAYGASASNHGARTFQLIATHMEFESIRTKLLENVVFYKKDGNKLLRSDDLRHRKILLDIESHKICAILWKESKFVLKAALPDGVRK